MNPPFRGFLTCFRVQAQIQGNLTDFRVQVPPDNETPPACLSIGSKGSAKRTKPVDVPARPVLVSGQATGRGAVAASGAFTGRRGRRR